MIRLIATDPAAWWIFGLAVVLYLSALPIVRIVAAITR